MATKRTSTKTANQKRTHKSGKKTETKKTDKLTTPNTKRTNNVVTETDRPAVFAENYYTVVELGLLILIDDYKTLGKTKFTKVSLYEYSHGSIGINPACIINARKILPCLIETDKPVIRGALSNNLQIKKALPGEPVILVGKGKKQPIQQAASVKKEVKPNPKSKTKAGIISNAAKTAFDGNISSSADIKITADITLEQVALGGNTRTDYQKRIICNCRSCEVAQQIEIPSYGGASLKPGARSGMEFVVKKQGHHLVNGTIGDLFVKINVLKHETIKVIDWITGDIGIKQKIDIFDVLLNNEIYVQTLYGPKKISASFKDVFYGCNEAGLSSIYTLSEYGLPDWHTGKKGDLLITFEIATPQKMPLKIRKLISKAKMGKKIKWHQPIYANK